MIKFTRLGWIISDYIFLFILLSFTANALIADWNWNPIHDLFYARIQGLLFYNAHSSSLLIVCATAFILLANSRLKDSTRIVLSVASIGAIHELIFELVRGQTLDPQNFRYEAAWIILLFLTYLFHRRDRKNLLRLLMIGNFVLLIEVFGVAAGIPVTQTGTFTLTEPSTQIIPNVYEVLSWLIPCVIYLWLAIHGRVKKP